MLSFTCVQFSSFSFETVLYFVFDIKKNEEYKMVMTKREKANPKPGLIIKMDGACFL